MLLGPPLKNSILLKLQTKPSVRNHLSFTIFCKLLAPLDIGARFEIDNKIVTPIENNFKK